MRAFVTVAVYVRADLWVLTRWISFRATVSSLLCSGVPNQVPDPVCGLDPIPAQALSGRWEEVS